jgi:hypothetical protein
MEGTIYGNWLPRGTEVKKRLGTIGIVFYMHQYKQSCRQNSGEGSKHVEDRKWKYLENVHLVGLYCVMNCTT